MGTVFMPWKIGVWECDIVYIENNKFEGAKMQHVYGNISCQSHNVHCHVSPREKEIRVSNLRRKKGRGKKANWLNLKIFKIQRVRQRDVDWERKGGGPQRLLMHGALNLVLRPCWFMAQRKCSNYCTVVYQSINLTSLQLLSSVVEIADGETTKVGNKVQCVLCVGGLGGKRNVIC